jgi:hypothetical protein
MRRTRRMRMKIELGRRHVLRGIAALAGGVVLVPSVHRVGWAQSEPSSASPSGLPSPPGVPPTGWDPVVYNRVRGNAGAIPASYLDSINGPDGDWDHVGKHLPWVPTVDGFTVPEGYVALMWGDPSKGHSKHPNAVRSEANQFEGHWYDWIRIRVASDDEQEEVESRFPEWPGTDETVVGQYAAHGGGELTDDAGKNTVYLAALPSNAVAGTTIRIWAHCLTHGEYVDFLRIEG